jgi:hypothetical protein
MSHVSTEHSRREAGAGAGAGAQVRGRAGLRVAHRGLRGRRSGQTWCSREEEEGSATRSAFRGDGASVSVGVAIEPATDLDLRGSGCPRLAHRVSPVHDGR